MNKNKFIDLTKMVKEEVPSSQRLQSLRMPRDLSLGGTKQIKKQFVPNVNVVRNKDKSKDFMKKNEQTRKERNSDIRQNRQKNNGQRYIQSTGVFSEGAAANIKRSNRSGDRRNNFKEYESGFGISMPTINKRSWDVNKVNEDNVFEQIMGDDESSEDEKLPFQPVTWNDRCFKEIKVPVKSEVKTEIEETKSETTSVVEPNLEKLKIETGCILPEEYMDGKFCSDDNPMLTLWSLPDSFAGKGLSDDPKCKKLFDYSLKDMLEGQIGKLIVRKSGRVEVHIGHVKYTLDSTSFDSYVEEIVELQANDEPRAAVLGQIQNRFLVSPEWTLLLK